MERIHGDKEQINKSLHNELSLLMGHETYGIAGNERS